MKKENVNLKKPLVLPVDTNPYELARKVHHRWMQSLQAQKQWATDVQLVGPGYDAFDDVCWDESTIIFLPTVFYKTVDNNFHFLPAAMLVRITSVHSDYSDTTIAGAVSDFSDYKWGDPLPIVSDMKCGDFVLQKDILKSQNCFSEEHYKDPIKFNDGWKVWLTSSKQAPTNKTTLITYEAIINKLKSIYNENELNNYA